jgi:hypothetical protein
MLKGGKSNGKDMLDVKLPSEKIGQKKGQRRDVNSEQDSRERDIFRRLEAAWICDVNAKLGI